MLTTLKRDVKPIFRKPNTDEKKSQLLRDKSDDEFGRGMSPRRKHQQKLSGTSHLDMEQSSRSASSSRHHSRDSSTRSERDELGSLDMMKTMRHPLNTNFNKSTSE